MSTRRLGLDTFHDRLMTVDAAQHYVRGEGGAFETTRTPTMAHELLGNYAVGPPITSSVQIHFGAAGGSSDRVRRRNTLLPDARDESVASLAGGDSAATGHAIPPGRVAGVSTADCLGVTPACVDAANRRPCRARRSGD